MSNSTKKAIIITIIFNSLAEQGHFQEKNKAEVTKFLRLLEAVYLFKENKQITEREKQKLTAIVLEISEALNNAEIDTTEPQLFGSLLFFAEEFLTYCKGDPYKIWEEFTEYLMKNDGMKQEYSKNDYTQIEKGEEIYQIITNIINKHL